MIDDNLEKKSKSKIIGRDGRLVWDNFPVALKYWMIE